MNNEFKKLTQNNVTRYILESGDSGGATVGGTGAGSVASFAKPMGGIQRRAGDDLIHQENKKSYKVSHKPKNPVAKAHQTVGTGSGAHTDKTKTLPRKEKHKKPADMTMENFNAEYDDEAGMSYNSLHTINRAATGLLNTIKEGDDLPEWCQEKISLAEDYLVTVWDYLQSEKEQGISEKITVVNDPEKATGVQTTSGITHGSVYAGRPMPQSLQQKLDGKPNTGRAVDSKGRTQQEWVDLVRDKFPTARVACAKMIDGPCFAYLPDGKTLSWKKVEQGVAEGEGDEGYVACIVQHNRSGQAMVQRTKPISRDRAEEVIRHALSKNTFVHPPFMTIYPASAGKLDGSTIMAQFPDMSQQGVAEGYEPPTYPHRSAAYHASLLRKKQERQAAADAKKKEQGVAEGNFLGQPGGIPAEYNKAQGNVSDDRTKIKCPYCHTASPKLSFGSDGECPVCDNPLPAGIGQKALAPKPVTDQGVAEGADSYMESLASTLAEKLDPNAEPEVWVQDFQKANPNKYHQFKNKTPQKKAQMAVAARRDARLKK